MLPSPRRTAPTGLSRKDPFLHHVLTDIDGCSGSTTDNLSLTPSGPFPTRYQTFPHQCPPIVCTTHHFPYPSPVLPGRQIAAPAKPRKNAAVRFFVRGREPETPGSGALVYPPAVQAILGKAKRSHLPSLRSHQRFSRRIPVPRPPFAGHGPRDDEIATPAKRRIYRCRSVCLPSTPWGHAGSKKRSDMPTAT